MLKSDVYKKSKAHPSYKRLFVLGIEEEGKIRELELEEGQICWEGFREVRGKLIRGVPKRSQEDCLKFCRHEGCQFI